MGDRLVWLMLQLCCEKRGEEKARVERAKKGEVDLAGSDRLRRSDRGVRGERRREKVERSITIMNRQQQRRQEENEQAYQGKQTKYACVNDFARCFKLAASGEQPRSPIGQGRWTRGVKNRAGWVDRFFYFLLSLHTAFQPAEGKQYLRGW